MTPLLTSSRTSDQREFDWIERVQWGFYLVAPWTVLFVQVGSLHISFPTYCIRCSLLAQWRIISKIDYLKYTCKACLSLFASQCELTDTVLVCQWLANRQSMTSDVVKSKRWEANISTSSWWKRVLDVTMKWWPLFGHTGASSRLMSSRTWVDHCQQYRLSWVNFDWIDCPHNRVCKHAADTL